MRTFRVYLTTQSVKFGNVHQCRNELQALTPEDALGEAMDALPIFGESGKQLTRVLEAQVWEHQRDERFGAHETLRIHSRLEGVR